MSSAVSVVAVPQLLPAGMGLGAAAATVGVAVLVGYASYIAIRKLRQDYQQSLAEYHARCQADLAQSLALLCQQQQETAGALSLADQTKTLAVEAATQKFMRGRVQRLMEMLPKLPHPDPDLAAQCVLLLQSVEDSPQEIAAQLDECQRLMERISAAMAARKGKAKGALGYNTLLPDKYDHNPCDGYFQHAFGKEAIDAMAKQLPDKSKFRVLSFGDEIGLGEIDYRDPLLQEKFRLWLKSKGVTRSDLGVDPAQAVLTKDGNPHLVWYANLFNEETRFAEFRANTEYAKKVLGPQVLTGANYSPHHLALFYGPIYQWVDIFKNNGMSMFWAEDYIFSVPEVPQIISWMFAEMHCAVKYNNQPIHFYVMPHAPGQLPRYLRQNMLFSIGAGAQHIDNFWVAPEEGFTENFVAWNHTESFKVLHEAIYDTAEAEKYQVGGKLRPGRVAVVLSKATDFNESHVQVDKANDPFTRISKNAPAKVNQILCRKDQQMLYVALRNTQHAVDLITEDDIAGGILKNYDIVYFAGEWIDTRAVKALDGWVRSGGILYATAGAGHLNQFNEPESAMRKLLGLKDNSKVEKNAAVIRTLLELPQMPPIDTITLNGQQIPAIGMKQQLVPDTAKVLGTWTDGSAAVTVNSYGKGKAFTVGTLAGNTYMKTGLRLQPWARGGRKLVYNPTDFDAAATQLMRLGIDAKPVAEQVVCANPFVEALVIDNANGTLLTLVNWTNGPVKNLKVTLKMPAKPKDARQVSLQKSIPTTYANGTLTLTVDLEDADYILLPK